MQAPKVQSLAEVMGTLDPAYSGQQALIDTQRAGLGAKYDAQRTGLNAEKVQGFDAINDQATGRGLSFSGIPLNEQAKYLSTKYLPGMQALNDQQNTADMALQGQSASLYSDKAKQGIGILENQKSTLNSWNMQQMQIQASARESALNRSAAQQAAQKAAQGPTENQFLLDQFATSYADENITNGWTENKLAGDYAAAYGISRKEALGKIYKFRKDSYGK